MPATAAWSWSTRPLDILNPKATTREDVRGAMGAIDTDELAWMLVMRIREAAGVAERGVWIDGTPIPEAARAYLLAVTRGILQPDTYTG